MFKRKSGSRRYEKVIYYVTEGSKTEPSYLGLINKMLRGSSVTLISCRSSKESASSVKEILLDANKAEQELKQKGKRLNKTDEIWILVDHDPECHTEDDFKELGQWEKADKRHYVAISCPRFEFWLLLHFKEAPSRQEALVDRALEVYLPGFSNRKDLSSHNTRLTRKRVEEAIRRAHALGPLPDCENPERVGSGVVVLVEKVLNIQRVGG